MRILDSLKETENALKCDVDLGKFPEWWRLKVILTFLHNYPNAKIYQATTGSHHLKSSIPSSMKIRRAIPDCLLPGYMVLTRDGVKPIEKIKVGDTVLSFDENTKKLCEGKVTEVMSHYVSDFAYLIHPYYLLPIKVTCNHPIYVREYCYKEYKDDSFRTYRRSISEPKWVPIKTICDAVNASKYSSPSKVKRFFVAYPFPTEVVDLPLDKEQCEFLGYYLAEGCFMRLEKEDRGLQFTLNENETDFADRIIELSYKLFDKIRSINNCVRVQPIYKTKFRVVRIYSDEAVNFIKELCFGRRAYEKMLKPQLILLPPEKQKVIIDSAWRGDGCIKRDRKSYDTTSMNLALQLHIMLLRNGIVGSITKRNPGRGYIVGKLPIYRIDVIDRKRANPRFGILEDGVLWASLFNVTKEPYEGYVYNLEVAQTQNYLTQAGLVHNCRGRLYVSDRRFEMIGAFGDVVFWTGKAKFQYKVVKGKLMIKWIRKRVPDREISLKDVLALPFWSQIDTHHRKSREKWLKRQKGKMKELKKVLRSKICHTISSTT